MGWQQEELEPWVLTSEAQTQFTVEDFIEGA
jgi:hypothetical protein